MWRIYGGAALAIAGIAAFIETHSHHPVGAVALSTNALQAVQESRAGVKPESAMGLSQTAYDLLRIGAWALVIVGGLLVLTGLIRYWTTMRGAS